MSQEHAVLKQRDVSRFVRFIEIISLSLCLSSLIVHRTFASSLSSVFFTLYPVLYSLFQTRTLWIRLVNFLMTHHILCSFVRSSSPFFFFHITLVHCVVLCLICCLFFFNESYIHCYSAHVRYFSFLIGFTFPPASCDILSWSSILLHYQQAGQPNDKHKLTVVRRLLVN